MSAQAQFASGIASARSDAAQGGTPDHAVNLAIEHERVNLLAQRSHEAGPAFIVGTILCAFVFHGSAPMVEVIGWVAVVAIINGYRVWLSRGVLSRAHHEDGQHHIARILRRYLACAAVNGMWFAFASVEYFGTLSTEGRAEWTILVLLSMTGSVLTYASYGAAFRALVLLSLSTLAFERGRLGTGSAYIIVFTLVGYCLTTIRFSRNLGDVFEHSVRIRFEREEAMKALD